MVIFNAVWFIREIMNAVFRIGAVIITAVYWFGLSCTSANGADGCSGIMSSECSSLSKKRNIR